MSMTLRAIPYASTLEKATQEMHIGCSVGLSTRFLTDEFPSAKVTGIDMSPYFLLVAQYKEKERSPRKNPITWIHAAGENTGSQSESFGYVFHECPERAIIALVNEAFRLLKPGGTLSITDQAPKSKIIQELPPALFTLMKSTEPFLNEYNLTDLEGRLREAGFVTVKSMLTDPRHMTMTASVPLKPKAFKSSNFESEGLF
ncbi:seed biotin-containing protein SBP65-like [Hibiscus syriacus]|uniref:Seed biotin-containing protein SBP65-like n=1 Tax=Hibiscus syriacus TaxID=106335 RepID=A0A6A2WQ07_HIBSY|nr:seed biotin-containing protein SBP65-like [Hibiscus syriacus]